MSYNWQQLVTDAPTVEISNVDPGVYEIEVIAINGLNEKSNVATLRHVVAPQEYVPSSPQGVSITPIDEFSALLSWDQSNDSRVTVGGKALIYHEPVLSGADWDHSTELLKNVSGAQASAVVPLLEGTYLVKFSTAENIRSNNAGKTTIRLCEPDPVLTIGAIEEDTTGFTGTKSSVAYDISKGGLILSLTTLFDSLAEDEDFDALPSIDFVGGAATKGEYVFSQVVDAGHVYDVSLTRRLRVEPYNIASFFDDNVAELDTWGDFDGVDVTDANASLYVRSTDQDPTPINFDSFTGNIDSWSEVDYGFAVWDEWRICTNSLLRGRGFQFKAVLTSEQANQNLVVIDLGVTAKLRQRIERATSPITSGTSTYTVNFVNQFYSSPSVTVTPLQTSTGDYHTITTPTASGFQVSFFDSLGNPVSRVFNYTAVGYGRRI